MRLRFPVGLAAILAVGFWSGMAFTKPPGQSIRPEQRTLVAVPEQDEVPVSTPRPPDRSAVLERVARLPRSPEPERPAASTGMLCGDTALRGAALPEIEGRISGCGVAQPVRVSHVDGLALSQPATMDCITARALSAWVKSAVRPVFGRTRGGVTGLKVAAHYSCRTRNNRPGGKISEHGKGRAIDISALRLGNGEEITVLEGWRDRRQRKMLRRLHDAACGPFGTVLGPEADRYHRDHFHLDTARYRSGSYCR